MAEEKVAVPSQSTNLSIDGTDGTNGTNGLTNGVSDYTSQIQLNPTLVRVVPEPVEAGTVLEGVSQKVFLDRYALKDEGGKAIEQYPEQMARRVARAISAVEAPSKQKEWEENFYWAMQDFKFVPGGRILSGAGTGFFVTYYNCYVLPSPADSRGGILENLKEMVEIMSRGGGVGVNLSSLRPRGSRVKKVNGFSSGPMSWAELYSVATHDIIQQGGTRRGALMLMLWDWHPDIEEFVTVKRDLTKIIGANLSVCASDKFMEQVAADGDWDLVFPDTADPDYDRLWDGILDHWVALGKRVEAHKTIKARRLWDLICEAAWASAEPGFVFMERYNKEHSNSYFNTINCVNPCVTADTLVSTTAGARRMGDLYGEGKPFGVVVDGKTYLSTPPAKTGTKKVYRLITKEGYRLRLTEDHKVFTLNGKVEAGKLNGGDKLVLTTGGSFGTCGTLEEGRVWGWLVGDGSVKKEDATLFFYGEEKKELAPVFAATISTMVATEAVNGREYLVAPVYVDKEDKAVVESRRLHRLAQRLGFEYGKKHFVPEAIFAGSEEMQRGFLQGLFSSDGHVAGTPEKGVSVRLTSVSEDLLIDTQRLLLNFGITSKIYLNRRIEMDRLLPDGHGGKRLFRTKAYHDLVIAKAAVAQFAALIGFLQEVKQEKLRSSLALYSRGPYRTSYTATFDRLEEDGVEDVFDITVAQVHRFVANGLIISNCGEEGLPAYGVCNLGSINLAPFVDELGQMDYEGLAEHAKLAVRFLDNVIEGDIYLFEGIRQTQLNGERRVGLGTMGLGDALIKMKVRYGCEQSLPIVEKIYRTIRDAAFEASADLAAEKGPFPKFDAQKYLAGPFIRRLPGHIRAKIAKQGIRNSVLLMQAPTGSTSLMAAVTSGIEPVYEFSFIRRDRLGEHKIYHSLYQKWLEEHPGQAVPDYFVSASDLTPEDHVRVQAAVQKYVDASISKTVNAPNSHTVEDVKKLYTLAYELGLKGITYMRDGSRPGVLSRESEVAPAPPQATAPGSVLSPRPEVLRGATYRMVTPVGSAFITINDDQEGNPVEVFVSVGKAGSDLTAMATALGRMLSTILRTPSQISPRRRAENMIEQLSGIGGRRSVGFGTNRVHSLPDAVAQALARHLGVSIGNGNGKPTLQAGAVMAAHNNPDPTLAPAEDEIPDEIPMGTANALTGADICPRCGVAALVWEEGCSKCYSCGHAEC